MYKSIPSQLARRQTSRRPWLSVRNIDAFSQKYAKFISHAFLLSQKDVAQEDNLLFKPVWMLPFILEEV